MEDRWTKFSYVVMIFSMIAGVIMVIVFTVMLANNRDLKSFTFPFFICGIFSVLAFHALWGMFIEMSYNIAELLYQVKKETNNTTVTQSLSPAGNSWVCSSCGNVNSSECESCQKCGNQKEKNAANPEIKSEISKRLNQIWSHQENDDNR